MFRIKEVLPVKKKVFWIDLKFTREYIRAVHGMMLEEYSQLEKLMTYTMLTLRGWQI